MSVSDKTNLLLVRIGEIALKGLNRRSFVRQLIRNIRYRINELGSFEVHEHSSRIWVRAQSDDIDMRKVIARITDVFGVVSVSPVQELPLNIPLWNLPLLPT